MIGTLGHPEKRPGQPAKQRGRRDASIGFLTQSRGTPRRISTGALVNWSLYWNRYELQEINGDYKTYEELRKARWLDYRLIRKYYFDGRGVVDMR